MMCKNVYLLVISYLIFGCGGGDPVTSALELYRFSDYLITESPGGSLGEAQRGGRRIKAKGYYTAKRNILIYCDNNV